MIFEQHQTRDHRYKMSIIRILNRMSQMNYVFMDQFIWDGNAGSNHVTKIPKNMFLIIRLIAFGNQRLTIFIFGFHANSNFFLFSIRKSMWQMCAVYCNVCTPYSEDLWFFVKNGEEAYTSRADTSEYDCRYFHPPPINSSINCAIIWSSWQRSLLYLRSLLYFSQKSW